MLIPHQRDYSDFRDKNRPDGNQHNIVHFYGPNISEIWTKSGIRKIRDEKYP